MTDTLQPAIRRLLGDMLAELGQSGKYTYEQRSEAVRYSPILRPVSKVITLLICRQFDKFSHPDEQIQADIRKQFEQMRGSFLLSVEELSSFYFFGKSVAQWGVEVRDGSMTLIDIQCFEPSPAVYTFKGKIGAIDFVTYKGDKDVDIPYSGEDGRIVHCVNDRHLTFRDPDGNAALDSVIPAHEATKIMLGEMLVAGQRQATPIIVGFSDSSATIPVLDAAGNQVPNEDGTPKVIQAPAAVLSQLEALDNRSVLSTDIKNRIEALKQETDGAFFFQAIKLLMQFQMLGLMVPESILVATGVGDSNLNTGHRTILGEMVAEIANQIKEALLEQVVRKLIVWNFGEQDSYGEFPTPKQHAIDELDLLGIFDRAFGTGWLSPADVTAVNRARDLMDLPPQESSTQAMGRLFSGNLDYWKVEGNGHGATLDR